MPTNDPRTLSELIEILSTTSSYQGMSDVEIQMIVEHEKGISHDQGYNEGLAENITLAQRQFDNTIIAETCDALQTQQNMLQSIIDRASNPQLQVIQYG